MATTILVKSENKTAINAIKVLAEELEMDVTEFAQESSSSFPKATLNDLIKSGIVQPADPSVKITDLAGIWTGRNITLKEIRKKAWQRNR